MCEFDRRTVQIEPFVVWRRVSKNAQCPLSLCATLPLCVPSILLTVRVSLFLCVDWSGHCELHPGGGYDRGACLHRRCSRVLQPIQLCVGGRQVRTSHSLSQGFTTCARCIPHKLREHIGSGNKRTSSPGNVSSRATRSVHGQPIRSAYPYGASLRGRQMNAVSSAAV